MSEFSEIETISISDRKHVEPTTEIGVCSFNREVRDMFGDKIDIGKNVLYYRNILEPSESESSNLHRLVNANGITLLVCVGSLSNIQKNVQDSSSSSCWNCSEDQADCLVYSSPFAESRSETESMCSDCLEEMQTMLKEYFTENRSRITVKLL